MWSPKKFNNFVIIKNNTMLLGSLHDYKCLKSERLQRKWQKKLLGILFAAHCHILCRIKFACAGVSVVSNTIFRLMMFCCVPEIFTIKSRSCEKLCENFYVFWAAKFQGKGPSKFLTEVYKSGSPSNVWQSSVMIGQATSEIRQQKKKI